MCGKQMHVGNTGTPNTGNRHYNIVSKSVLFKRLTPKTQDKTPHMLDNTT